MENNVIYCEVVGERWDFLEMLAGCSIRFLGNLFREKLMLGTRYFNRHPIIPDFMQH